MAHTANRARQITTTPGTGCCASRRSLRRGALLALLLASGVADLAHGAGTPDAELAAIDQAVVKRLMRQGSLVIVRQRPDLTLVDVTAGQVIDAPLEVVWATLTDFESYPRFMPQTESVRVVERQGAAAVTTEQALELKIWRLPSLDITYRLAYALAPPDRISFHQVSGDLKGTRGSWTLVRAGAQTLAFHTLYSNLTELGWGVGGVFRGEPDFMAGVNVTTAMMVTKAVKGESERRAKKSPG